MLKLDTSIDCEVVRNKFLAEFAEKNTHVSDEQLKEVLDAVINGGEAFLAIESLHRDDQIELRQLAVAGLLGELQRRLEVAELEDRG